MKFSKFSFLQNFFKKRKRSRLRSIIRGHHKLKKSGELSKLADLKRLLSDQKLNISSDLCSSFIMGESIDASLKEVSIRQYLLLRIGAYKLNEALLFKVSNPNKKIISPMPKEWRKILNENGFTVANKRSAILWQIYLFMLIGYSFLKFLLILSRSVWNFRKEHNKDTPYVYFANLTKGNLPKKKDGKQSYDILSWYIKYSAPNNDLYSIKHDVDETTPIFSDDIKINYSQSGPIPFLKGWNNILYFSIWFFLAITKSLIDLFRGRWWHALILNEAVLSKQISLIETNKLAKKYFFHNTGQTYRPLWTYYAEKHGCEITLYFYSTNVENFKSAPTYYWRCMTWPNYLVWDKYQAEFIKRCIGNYKGVKAVKSIWFSDGGSYKVSNYSNKSIAIFDVTPHRLSKSCIGLEEKIYVNGKNCKKFLQDILEVAKEKEIKCLLKAKREIAHLNIEDKGYTKYKEKISHNFDLIKLNPSISPYDIINSCDLTISLPFTAPSIIARELGKPSCYYDPTNTIDPNHQAAHGITIIGSKETLSDWVNKNC